MVLFEGCVAGNVVSWRSEGRQEVGYWLGGEWWGRGIATAALSQLLGHVPQRPLHACVAPHNAGSLRVLEKCGFVRSAQLTCSAAGRELVELALTASG
jgi:RimJ/RimL family protein N-acetyltransferase